MAQTRTKTTLNQSHPVVAAQWHPTKNGSLTPDQVVARLRTILEETRPSILALWGNDGSVNHEDSMDCIRLMGQEVMPALREIGKDLGLDSPFDVDSPISLAETPASELLATRPDGIFLSNGPGDPAALDEITRSLTAIGYAKG